MNDLCFTVKNKKKACKDEKTEQASIFAIKLNKKGKNPHFGNKKAIIPIFFVSILWFLYAKEQ